jgi:hypothetical protein
VFRSKAEFERAMASKESPDKVFTAAVDPGPSETLISGRERSHETWAEVNVVASNGAYYVLTQAEINEDDGVFGLWRIEADARTTQTCAVEALPGGRDGGLGPLKGTAVDAFATLVATVSGDEVRGSGTMHSQGWTLFRGGLAQARLAARPWVLGQADVHNSRQVIDDDLALWARASLYDFRLRRAWPEAEAAARAALTKYYQESFALTPPAAADAASRALDILVRSYFVFPSGGMRTLPEAPYRGLTNALLRGASRGEIMSLLQAGYELRTSSDTGDQFEEEPSLFFALESPGNVATLLEAGADPNTTGNFDKTALMYAAQFDLYDSAKTLLIYGADPNLATRDEYARDTYIKYDHRTPLMYAAENAAPRLIRLLLDYKADPTAKDSEGRDVLDYLARNPKLGDADRAALAAEIRQAIAARLKP